MNQITTTTITITNTIIEHLRETGRPLYSLDEPTTAVETCVTYRITSEEADELIDCYCWDADPHADALERATAHEWTFPVMASIPSKHKDEVDDVLYG